MSPKFSDALASGRGVVRRSEGIAEEQIIKERAAAMLELQQRVATGSLMAKPTAGAEATLATPRGLCEALRCCLVLRADAGGVSG